MISSDGDDSDYQQAVASPPLMPPLVLKPLAVLKKITKMRRQVAHNSPWLYQILKKAESEIEQALSSHLEKHSERAAEPIASTQAGVQAQYISTLATAAPAAAAPAAVTIPSPKIRAPRHPSLTSKRYVWKKEEEDVLRELLKGYSSKNKEVNWTAISRKLRISEDKCKRKAKSLGRSESQIEIESEEEPAPTTTTSALPPPSSAPQHPLTSQAVAAAAAVVVGEKRTRETREGVTSSRSSDDTPLRTQVHRVLQLSGGQGTVDEIVEELLVEPRWMREEGGRVGLRKRVAAVLSSGGSGLGLFESTTQLRGAAHKRIVYRNIG